MSIKTDKIQVGKFQWFYRQTEVESERTHVLFLHGLPSHSYTWQKLMSFLAESEIPSIAPDWLAVTVAVPVSPALKEAPTLKCC